MQGESVGQQRGRCAAACAAGQRACISWTKLPVPDAALCGVDCAARSAEAVRRHNWGKTQLIISAFAKARALLPRRRTPTLLQLLLPQLPCAAGIRPPRGSLLTTVSGCCLAGSRCGRPAAALPDASCVTTPVRPRGRRHWKSSPASSLTTLASIRRSDRPHWRSRCLCSSARTPG